VKIDISKQATGVYLLKITDENGMVSFGRVVKGN
jgi:hypothetical protein